MRARSIIYSIPNLTADDAKTTHLYSYVHHDSPLAVVAVIVAARGYQPYTRVKFRVPTLNLTHRTAPTHHTWHRARLDRLPRQKSRCGAGVGISRNSQDHKFKHTPHIRINKCAMYTERLHTLYFISGLVVSGIFAWLGRAYTKYLVARNITTLCDPLWCLYVHTQSPSLFIDTCLASTHQRAQRKWTREEFRPKAISHVHVDSINICALINIYEYIYAQECYAAAAGEGFYHPFGFSQRLRDYGWCKIWCYAYSR